MINRLEFPEVTQAAAVFGNYPKEWFKKTLEDTRKEGIDKEYISMANKLFFDGGELDINDSLDKDYISKGLLLLRAVLGSYAPKHEHKEIVAAKIIESLCRR